GRKRWWLPRGLACAQHGPAGRRGRAARHSGAGRVRVQPGTATLEGQDRVAPTGRGPRAGPGMCDACGAGTGSRRLHLGPSEPAVPGVGGHRMFARCHRPKTPCWRKPGEVVPVKILPALQRWRWLALAVAGSVLAVTVLFLLVAPRSYTASSVVAVVPNEDTFPGGELVSLAVPTYASLATSESLAATIAEASGEDMTALAAAISADVPSATNTVVVSVRWS